MGDILNWDNKFFQALNKIIDCILVSILWLICSLPIVTMGAASSAMYYTINKVIRNNHGYVTKEFFHSFANCLKQSTVVWLVFWVIAAFLGLDAYIMWGSLKAGNAMGNLVIVFLVFIAFDMMWVMYALTYISRFQNTIKNIMKNALLMAVADFGKTLLLFLILAATIFAIWMLPFLAVLIPGFVTCLMNVIFEKIFRKYMSEEDIKEEEERNREYLN